MRVSTLAPIAMSVLLASALLAALVFARPACAAEAATRTITVSGEGNAAATPDTAQISTGITSEAASAAAALTANSAAMRKIMDALRAAGIPDRKIQTSNFSVSPQYPPYRQENPEPRHIIGYQVSNQVTVIVDDVSKLGAVLDAVVRSGANQIGGISFSVADPKPLADEARRAAVEDAAAKAKTLAAAAGVTLGPLLTIQESGGTIVAPRPMAFEAKAASVPVSLGESEISAGVTLVYAIQ